MKRLCLKGARRKENVYLVGGKMQVTYEMIHKTNKGTINKVCSG